MKRPHDAFSKAKDIFNTAEQKDSLRPEVLALLLLKERYSVEGVWKNLWRLQDAANDERRRNTDERIRQLDFDIRKLEEEGILFSHD